MAYLTSLSKAEANYILTSFHRLKGYHEYYIEMCSHPEEKEFFCKHNSLILDCRTEFALTDPVKLIHGGIADLAANENFLKRIILKFQNAVKRMHFTETLLWCSSLLMEYHSYEECSEYMTLALKFRLLLYWRIEFGEGEPPSTVMKTMTDFLFYVIVNKCNDKLFTSGLGFFLRLYPLNSTDDPLESYLYEVMHFAHCIHFNIFSTWNSEFKLNFKKYAELSILQNLDRFLILAGYGYEDIRFDRDIDCYVILLYAYDRYNSFGVRSRFDEIRKLCMSNTLYRSLQVMALYIQTTYEFIDPGKEIYEEALLTLWETISDPYLTPRHFMFFEQLGEFPEYFKAWKWYSRIVLNDKTPESSPRSLKHLSRCSVRRTLTKCAQLPFALKSLDIPQTLKSYLGLEKSFYV